MMVLARCACKRVAPLRALVLRRARARCACKRVAPLRALVLLTAEEADQARVQV